MFSHRRQDMSKRPPNTRDYSLVSADKVNAARMERITDVSWNYKSIDS